MPKLNKEQMHKYRDLFRNYKHMKFEISALNSNIAFFEKYKSNEISEDIYSASVSHKSGEAIGYNPNVSVDKIPNIVASMDMMKKKLNSDVDAMEHKRRVFELATKTIDDYMELLPEKKSEIIRLCLIERRNYSYTANKTGYCERQISYITNQILEDFAKCSHIDVDLVLSLIK